MNDTQLFQAFDGKKVLICGASGMTGRNLMNLMEYLCCKEVVGTAFTKKVLGDKLERVDFTKAEETAILFKEHNFDYVFVCCAQTYNAFVCRNNPTALILPNIVMVSNILENSLKSGVKKVLMISSSTVYQPSFKKLSEDDLDLNQEPNELYKGVGWAKRYIERLCEFYNTLGLETVVVRPTNIFGRYDKTDQKVNHVIPALIGRALRKEDPYTVYGNGMAVKDFIFASDFVRDLALIMANYTGSPLNVCSGSEVSIKRIVSIILDEVRNLRVHGDDYSSYSPRVVFTETKPDQVPYRGLDKTKFNAILGEQEYKNIREGLKETVEWLSLSHQIQKV